ncbi:FAD-binding protein [Saccharopolyspora mangrovi]|uniref:FAD-dependent monooxygenase n=1 Tax=Saccharopolyspora mangrovi TaxID=3082379 RepID=A0ABU6A899_9PSEU|nr:FAD-binding protein [Saccharopolyspora sp. S2-29]MEB3367729.1 FAD-dependent monooxygenase [Saccharopolyspora sp. S2-29]
MPGSLVGVTLLRFEDGAVMVAEGRAPVVGAGGAGLATALRLSRSGRRVALVQRAAELRAGGCALTLSGLGFDAAERMGLVPALRAAQPEPVELLHVTESGRPLARMPPDLQHALLGDRPLSLFRGDIERVLRSGSARALSNCRTIRC